MVYKWGTTEERTEGDLKPKTEPLYRSAVAAAQGRVTRGASELIEDVEAVSYPVFQCAVPPTCVGCSRVR